MCLYDEIATSDGGKAGAEAAWHQAAPVRPAMFDAARATRAVDALMERAHAKGEAVLARIALHARTRLAAVGLTAIVPMPAEIPDLEPERRYAV